MSGGLSVNMGVFQQVRAQLDQALMERVCRRHNDNKQAFFDLLTSMTEVKIIQDPALGHIVEGPWEALEKCHMVLYKYQAELCAEELADLADQQNYPGNISRSASGPVTPSMSGLTLTSPSKKPCLTPSFGNLGAPLNLESLGMPPTSMMANGGPSASLDASAFPWANPAASLINSAAGAAALAHLASRVAGVRAPELPNPTPFHPGPLAGLDLSIKSMANPLPPFSRPQSLTPGGVGLLGGGIDDNEHDNISVGGSSEHSPLSPDSGIASKGTKRSALDSIMSMKVEPPSSVKSEDMCLSVPSPPSESSARSLSGGEKKYSRRGLNSAFLSAKNLVGAGDSGKIHPCPVCGVHLGSSMNLKKHIQRKHSRPAHKCDICGKAYGFINDLREHKKIHFSNLPCNQCDKVFKSRRSLLGHLSMAHKDSGVPPPPPPRSADIVTPNCDSQSLNLGLYSSLSAINNFFSGLESDSSERNNLTPSMSQNFLQEIGTRLNPSSLLGSGETPNLSNGGSANGGVLNLAKPLDASGAGPDSPKKTPVASTLPVEVSCQ